MAVAVVLFAAGLSAQGKPSFAGKWTQDAPAGGAAAGGGGGGGGRGGGRGGGGGGFCGASCEIAQDATTLTVSRAGQDGAVTKTVYKLDGSESKNSVNMGGNAVESSSKATWDGSKLKIVTTTNFNGNARETTTVVSMDGAKLSVATTAPGRQGGDPTTTTSTYTKG